MRWLIVLLFSALASVSLLAGDGSDAATPVPRKLYFGDTSQGTLVVARVVKDARAIRFLDLDVRARCRGRRLLQRIAFETVSLERVPLQEAGRFQLSGRLDSFNSAPPDAGQFPVVAHGLVEGRFVTPGRLVGRARIVLRGTFYLGGGSGKGFLSQRAVCRTGRMQFSAETGREAGSRRGSLREVRGSKGCSFSRRRTACLTLPRLGGPTELMLPRDGRHVYALSFDPRPSGDAEGFLLAFRRDSRSGALRRLAGDSWCVRAEPAPGCRTVRGLSDIGSAAIAPDGRHVYLAGADPPAIATLSRNRRTGALSQLPGSGGCLGSPTDDCAPAPPVDSLYSIEVSPDGRQIYLTWTTLVGEQQLIEAGLLWLSRDRGNGALGPFITGAC